MIKLTEDCYKLQHGDIFTIYGNKELLSTLQNSNKFWLFIPLRYYRKFIWNKPSTWFKTFWDVKFVLTKHMED